VSRFRVQIGPDAEAELRDAFHWYRKRSPLAAEAFRSAVIEAIDALADRADLWPKDGDGFHFHPLSRFPYTVWYDLAADIATVLAIAHQHRRPGYWKSRTG
jgi:plasmid stabilization system protein ParE